MKNGNTKPAKSSRFGPVQNKSKVETRTSTSEIEIEIESKQDVVGMHGTETKEEVEIDRKVGRFDSVQTNNKAFHTGEKDSQNARNFESKEGEEITQEADTKEKSEINKKFEEEINVEESQVNEEIVMPKIKAYFVISEVDSLNLEEVANHHSLSYAQVNKTSDLIPTLTELSQRKTLTNTVLIKSTQISISTLSQLPKIIKAHFIFIQNKVDQPPLVEETREYMIQLEKQLGNDLSLSQVYIESDNSLKRITNRLEIILDNPALDILQVY